MGIENDVGGPDVAEAEQEWGETIAENDYVSTDGEAVESLGDIPYAPVQNPN